ncbi:amidohydrolase family protein [Variovorax sp. LT1R20]|uniref:amidohydrolase family protein n=1 Tax=Variovorax sp. LT1R20 TaxID=3443729 RepID=UPI003F48B769
MKIYVVAVAAFLLLSFAPRAEEAPKRQKQSRLAIQAEIESAASGTDGVVTPQAPIPFIDAHAHLNDATSQLKLMNAYGASRAVVFWGGRSDNESVAEAARRWPDRFIAFASISPERSKYRLAWEHEDPVLLDELDRLLASGHYKGIGEISVAHFPGGNFAETGFSVTGPLMVGIFSLARKYGVPVLVHIEWTHMHELSTALERFSDVKVIWAHGGYTPLFIAQRMLARHPNLYYELSARTWPHHPRSPDYTILRNGRDVWPEWLQLIEAQPDRFTVGTDATQRSATGDALKFQSVQNLLGQLSPAARDKVATENVLRLCGMGPNDR